MDVYFIRKISRGLVISRDEVNNETSQIKKAFHKTDESIGEMRYIKRVLPCLNKVICNKINLGVDLFN